MIDEAFYNKIKTIQQEHNLIQEQKIIILESLKLIETQEKENTEKLREILTHNLFLDKEYISFNPHQFGTIKYLNPLTINDFKYTAFLRQAPNHHDYTISNEFSSIQFTDLSSVFKLISQYQDIDELSKKNEKSFNNFFAPGKFVILKSFNKFKQSSKIIIIKM